MVAGVQHHQAHAGEDMSLYPVHDLIRHSVMAHMAPPDQHIRVRQDLLRQPAFRIVQSGRAHLNLLTAQETCYVGVEPAGIQLRHTFLRFFVQILVPYRYFHGKPSILMLVLSFTLPVKGFFTVLMETVSSQTIPYHSPASISIKNSAFSKIPFSVSALCR